MADSWPVEGDELTNGELYEMACTAARAAGCDCALTVTVVEVFADPDGGRMTATRVEHQKSKCTGYRRYVGKMGDN